MPAPVANTTVRSGIRVKPAAYDTTSDDVSGFNRTKKISQPPYFSSLVWTRATDAVENQRFSQAGRIVRAIMHAMPAPTILPASDNAPPRKPPKITPPGA